MRAVIHIAASSYNSVIRSSFYFFLLLVLAGGVLLTPYMTLFEFGKDANLIRELSSSTIFIWILLCGTLGANLILSEEVENKIIYTLLTKPMSAGQFLSGKLLGLAGACVLGVALLSALSFYSIWQKSGTDVAALYEFSASRTYWEYMRHNFFDNEVLLLAQNVYLNSCMCAVTAAVAVFCFSLLPQNAAFVLSIGIVLASQAIHAIFPLVGTVLPSLIFFQLPTNISNGTLLSARFLALSLAYLLSYSSLILCVNTLLFSRKDA